VIPAKRLLTGASSDYFDNFRADRRRPIAPFHLIAGERERVFLVGPIQWGEKVLAHFYRGPTSASGADSDVDRSRAGSALIAYPVRADMMDPPMVRRSEPA
jgi:hypothetical protein